MKNDIFLILTCIILGFTLFFLGQGREKYEYDVIIMDGLDDYPTPRLGNVLADRKDSLQVECIKCDGFFWVASEFVVPVGSFQMSDWPTQKESRIPKEQDN